MSHNANLPLSGLFELFLIFGGGFAAAENQKSE